ncbi:MAG: YchJ family metal-binding protein [Pseudomonadota bacterium]
MFETCPCSSGKGCLACCGRLRAGAPAPTAEALLRARYAAYARGDATYVLSTWAPDSRPPSLDPDPARASTGLAVGSTRDTGPETAEVRFTARCRQGAKKVRLTETSRFRLDGAGWVYVDGDLE